VKVLLKQKKVTIKISTMHWKIMVMMKKKWEDNQI